MLVLLILLSIGAAIGTFLENDFNNAYAKAMIYTSWWYQGLLILASLNLILIFLKKEKNLFRPGPIFHFAFVIILIGAFFTFQFGVDGSMHIREGEKSNTFKVGNQKIELPFYIHLKDFKLKRYPGSRAPSSFSSDVSIADNENNRFFDANIYMNNTLTYEGYKFFQTSYDEDEKGTILTVNKDPGVMITYIGYALLFIGLILTFFDKKSRIRFLLKKIKEMPIASILLFLFLSVSNNLFSTTQQYSSYIEQYLNEHKIQSKNLAKSFGELIVQGPTGRMKPLDTQNREILNKLTGKSTWNGMTHNQVVMGMFSRPEIWKKVNIIKVKTPQLRKILGVNPKQKLVAFNDFFNEKGEFKLTELTNKANQIPPSKRGTFERDLIQVDELLNIAFMSYRAMLIKIFPKPNDIHNEWIDFFTFLNSEKDFKHLSNLEKFIDEIHRRDYSTASIHLEKIKQYQTHFGKKVIPTKRRVKTELLYNKTKIFIRLSIAYLLLGLFLIFYSLSSMFYNKIINSKLKTGVNFLILSLFIIHSIGIAVRWYIGGYAPISNTYETMIYIAYSAILASILFLRKSIIGLGASLIMAGVFIFSAYLGEINPQITSLVPVLKSYWLSIHVSVITASYGFLGISALLGVLTLVIFSLRKPSRKHLDAHIKNITYINEATITVGIILLTIGNFLGAIWANESWGRYWGWDPKETWTYISILIYGMLIHLRLIRKIYSHYLFAIGSVFSFSSILMTYYGVNFYLSGMHSYATGDPVPMPNWVFILIGCIVLLIIFSFQKRKFKHH